MAATERAADDQVGPARYLPTESGERPPAGLSGWNASSGGLIEQRSAFIDFGGVSRNSKLKDFLNADVPIGALYLLAARPHVFLAYCSFGKSSIVTCDAAAAGS
jgi:hypothetical protein